MSADAFGVLPPVSILTPEQTQYSAIGGISAPILIAVAVIAILVAAFKHLWDTNEDFRNKMISIWDGIVEKITSFVDTVKSKFAALDIDFETIVDVLKNIWDAFCNFLAPMFIELGERANLANQWDGDLFISLHCNAIDASPERKKQIRGYHVYVLRAP